MQSFLSQIAACYSHIQRTFSPNRGDDEKASQQLIRLCGTYIILIGYDMGLHMTKPVFGASDLATETSKKIEISLVASLDDTFQKENNKGANQSLHLCCLQTSQDRFQRRGPYKDGLFT